MTSSAEDYVGSVSNTGLPHALALKNRKDRACSRRWEVFLGDRTVTSLKILDAGFGGRLHTLSFFPRPSARVVLPSN